MKNITIIGSGNIGANPGRLFSSKLKLFADDEKPPQTASSKS